MDFQKPQSHYRMTIKLSLRNWVLGAAAHCWRTWQSAGPHLSCVQEQPLPPRWAACWQGRRGWALGFLHRHIDLDLPKCDLGTSKPARPLCLQLGIIYVCVGRAIFRPSFSLSRNLEYWGFPLDLSFLFLECQNQISKVKSHETMLTVEGWWLRAEGTNFHPNRIFCYNILLHKTH